jgi:hypothetical protein
VLPRLGFGPIGGMLMASALAGGLALWGERRLRRRRAAGPPASTVRAGARRGAVPPGVRWAALALGGLVVLYLVLVARAGG